MKQRAQSLIGRTIVGIRSLRKDELYAVGWEASSTPAMAIELDDGTWVVASRDQERNGPGVFVVLDEDESYLILSDAQPADAHAE